MSLYVSYDFAGDCLLIGMMTILWAGNWSERLGRSPAFYRGATVVSFEDLGGGGVFVPTLVRALPQTAIPRILKNDIINPMKAETHEWLIIAQADYSDSLYLFNGARYPNAIYFICQAIEKLLKAIQIESFDQMPKKTHNLTSLAKSSGLSFSAEQIQILEDLFTHFNRVRYPDYQRTKYNTKAKVEPIIKQGKEMYQWILARLKNL